MSSAGTPKESEPGEVHAGPEPGQMYIQLKPVGMTDKSGRVYQTSMSQLIERPLTKEDPKWLQRVVKLTKSPLLHFAVDSLHTPYDSSANAGHAVDKYRFPRLEPGTLEKHAGGDGDTWLTRTFVTDPMDPNTLRVLADPSQVPAVDLLILGRKLTCPGNKLMRVSSRLSDADRSGWFDEYVDLQADRSRIARDTNYVSSQDKAVSDWFSYQLSRGATWADGSHFETIRELEAYAKAWGIPLENDQLHAALLRLIDRTSTVQWNPAEARYQTAPGGAPAPASVVKWCLETTFGWIRNPSTSRARKDTKDKDAFPFPFTDSTQWNAIDPAYYPPFVIAVAYFVGELPYQLPERTLYTRTVLEGKLIDFSENVVEQRAKNPMVAEAIERKSGMVDHAFEIMDTLYRLYHRMPDLLNKRTANPLIPLEARAQVHRYRIKAHALALKAGILPGEDSQRHAARDRFNGNGTASVIFPPS